EALVHLGGDRFVLERLALHHVAPMARRVADGEEDGLVLALRALEGLVAPRVPIDGVVRVLPQVRARLAREPIFVVPLGSCAHALEVPPEARHGDTPLSLRARPDPPSLGTHPALPGHA